MNDSTPKPETTELLDDEAIEAPMWRNLIFLKNGRTLFGAHTFPSAESAAAAIPPSEELMRAWLAAHPTMEVVKRTTRRHLYYVSEYSHAIPVPWSSK